MSWLMSGALLLSVGAPLQAPDTVPLYTDLGAHHHEITTSSPRAQQYFDQGLRLTYAFNHAEAIRSFREAQRLDPSCAMCYWGEALAYGPNINAPMDSASGAAAYAAVRRAVELAPGASAREQAYIRALAERYGPDPTAERAARDSAYARAMGEVARQHPDDLDAATLHAEALMDLSPWVYWTREGQPRPQTAELVASLERVLAENPDHPGACHYYIHAVEAVEPERAVACAERLAGLMPGAGHIVHMPGHIYLRVGRYADAIEANRHALHADESYIADQRPAGLYPLAYYPHNYHFLALAAFLSGQGEEAVRTARTMVEAVDRQVAAQVLDLQAQLVYPHLMLVSFGRWDEVLREPVPSSELRLSTGMTHYARGVAFAATGRWGEAEAALDSVELAATQVDAEPWSTVLEIATRSLAGEIAARRGQPEAAIEHVRAAMEMEDGLQYMEPPFWYYPVRHSLGAVLLQAGRPAEAEALYREDLERFPENGWSLFGLAESLRAQGRQAEAVEVMDRFRRAWSDADVQLVASRF